MICNPGNKKNTIEIVLTLFFLLSSKGNFAEKPAAKEVELIELKHSLRTTAERQTQTQALTRP